MHARAIRLHSIATVAAAMFSVCAASCERKSDGNSARKCGADTDCKGDRVCQHGACVDPTPAPSLAPTSVASLPASSRPIETISMQVCRRLEGTGVVTNCQPFRQPLDVSEDDAASFDFVKRPYSAAAPDRCGTPGDEPCNGQVHHFATRHDYQVMFDPKSEFYCAGAQAGCYGSARTQTLVIPANVGSAGGDKVIERKIHSVVDSL